MSWSFRAVEQTADQRLPRFPLNQAHFTHHSAQSDEATWWASVRYSAKTLGGFQADKPAWPTREN